MAEIQIKKGLDIPIDGIPKGPVQTLEGNGKEIVPLQIALNFSRFIHVKPRLLIKEDEAVGRGQPLIQDKAFPDRMFVSPAGGIVKEVRRGLKRRLLDVVIEISREEEEFVHPTLDISTASREEILSVMLAGGMFAKIRQRPFNLLSRPNQTPRAIFVKAIESAPFVPPPELQVEGYEESFQVGLYALKKLTTGLVHLVYRRGSDCSAFTHAQGVEKHTAEGPHPIGTHSVHIHTLSPIQKNAEVVWTLNANDVVAIGELLSKGTYHYQRIIGIGGPGVLPEKRGYFRVREGISVENLIAGRMPKGSTRLISGDPLMGNQVDPDDFLGFYHYAFTIIPESVDRQFLHFFRLGGDKFTASRAYLSGFFKNSERQYPFTTNQHGEKRAFVIASPYDKVMPMNIPTMHLVKAVMAKDYDLAEELGFLEVAEEDFALATFCDPCKMEMVDIMYQGLQNYAKEVIH